MNLDIKVPDNLDAVILDAMSRARRKKRNRLNMAVSVASVVAVVLLSLNTSSVFASFFKNPLNFIHTINTEMYNKLSQSVNLSQTKDNLTFTIKEIVSDPHRLYIPFTMETKAGMENKLRYKFTDANGNVLFEEIGFDDKGNHISGLQSNHFIAGGSSSIDEEQPGVYSGHFDLQASMHYQFTENIKLEIAFSDNPVKTWTFDLINKPKDIEIYEYAIKQDINLRVNDKTYNLRAENLVFYPTTTTLYLTTVKDGHNVEFIEKMHLEDEQGNRAEYRGDFTELDSKGDYVTRKTFDSLHMFKPKELYLVIEEIRDLNWISKIGEAEPTFKVMKRVKLQ
ncbi:DUF4179 domain-containing protein [Paenibacillus chitinolyticus]|uniref:DUF4179 domain-containing protein n=1 Tax=Paenibacillus chitinolyticus TaxID=79263 RepID=UPI002DBB8043|nr:DUF4179 domain-containing protein [Paenibacillus chitinolyticus]MEC0245910.1 DUF4179 domain-containing protein [Paenibacillus chitinolyticus]